MGKPILIAALIFSSLVPGSWASTTTSEVVPGPEFYVKDADSSDGIEMIGHGVRDGKSQLTTQLFAEIPFTDQDGRSREAMVVFSRKGDELYAGPKKIGAIGKDGRVAFAEGVGLELVLTKVQPTWYESLRYGLKPSETLGFRLKLAPATGPARERGEERRREMGEAGKRLSGVEFGWDTAPK